MIDHQARSQLAQATRALLVGRITNDQFEARQPKSDDPAIREIFYHGFWPLYSDTREYRLTGKHKLTPERRRFAARCIVFLKSGLPYSWPALSMSADFMLQIRNVLPFGRASREYDRCLSSRGDVTLWPFQSAEQYAESLRSPAYLSGMGANNSFKPNPLLGSA
jgi:hypothetical protein